MVIDTLNLAFFILFAVFLMATIVLRLFFKNSTEKTKRTVVGVLYFLMLIYYFVYKYQLSMDTAYSVIQETSGAGPFSWWAELPLNLCNISLILMPISMLSNSKSMKSFLFFIGPIGALMALLMPTPGFAGYSLNIPRVCGFYVTHFAVLFGGAVLCSQGLYSPRLRDVISCFCGFILIATIVFGINYLIRKLGYNQYVNYFYLMEPPVNNEILKYIYSWVPYPGLYMLPIYFGAVLPYMFIVLLIAERLRKRG